MLSGYFCVVFDLGWCGLGVGFCCFLWMWFFCGGKYVDVVWLFWFDLYLLDYVLEVDFVCG